MYEYFALLPTGDLSSAVDLRPLPVQSRERRHLGHAHTLGTRKERGQLLQSLHLTPYYVSITTCRRFPTVPLVQRDEPRLRAPDVLGYGGGHRQGEERPQQHHASAGAKLSSFQSIERAHSNLVPARLFYSDGDVEGVAINRSPTSYDANPEEERARSARRFTCYCS